MQVGQIEAVEPAHFRRVMSRFATGVTVIVATAHGETRGMTANAFMSGSLDPPLCVVSIAQRAHMHQHLQAAQNFSVNILAAGQENYATHFGGRPVPGFAAAFASLAGVPTLAAASAQIAAEIAARHSCGDHTIFIGCIRGMTADERPPLLYHAGHYAALGLIRAVDTPVPEFW
jgi:flavin reductase (DIM6/NTAB) family NADH-FMN oxidoreductase RutF